MGSDAALEELRVLLDHASVLNERDDLDRYCTPARGAAGDARAVLRPSSLDAVRTVLAWARRHRIRLIPQGANSGLVGASTPPPGGGARSGLPVVLSTERLREGPHIDAASRTAVAGAGVRLSELNDAARDAGLELPIDLGADPSLGGMAATNTGGSRMVRHGDMRAHVLGLRAVCADEDCSVVDELTVLRKHNVGPSVSQLLVGAGGAFAVITDVAVQLTPLPSDRACAWVTPRDAAASLEVLVRLERCATALSAFEVLSAAAFDAARTRAAPGEDPLASAAAPEVIVLVELSGAAGAQDALVAALDDLAGAGLVEDAVIVPAATAWALRHRVSEGLRAQGAVVGFDISVPRSDLPAFREAATLAVGRVAPDAIVADFGHWGDGGVHCNVVLPGVDVAEGTLREQLADAVLGLAVGGFGGSFSAEHGIGPLNAPWWRRSTSDGTRVALAGLAGAMDPLGVLGHPGLPYVSSSTARAAGNGSENSEP